MKNKYRNASKLVSILVVLVFFLSNCRKEENGFTRLQNLVLEYDIENQNNPYSFKSKESFLKETYKVGFSTNGDSIIASENIKIRVSSRDFSTKTLLCKLNFLFSLDDVIFHERGYLLRSTWEVKPKINQLNLYNNNIESIDIHIDKHHIRLTDPDEIKDIFSSEELSDNYPIVLKFNTSNLIMGSKYLNLWESKLNLSKLDLELALD